MYTLKSDNLFCNFHSFFRYANIFLLFVKIFIDFCRFSQYNKKRIDYGSQFELISNSGRIPLLHKQETLRVSLRVFCLLWQWKVRKSHFPLFATHQYNSMSGYGQKTIFNASALFPGI